MLQIKFGSVNLAKKYMKRVATEIQSKAALEKDPALDYMLLQGVRFAFRIHQVCSMTSNFIAVHCFSPFFCYTKIRYQIPGILKLTPFGLVGINKNIYIG